jgi:hypothetical protein
VATTETLPVAGMGLLPIPEDFYKYFEERGTLLQQQPRLGNGHNNKNGERDQARRIIGREFNLGILERDLPPSVIKQESGLTFDIYNCASAQAMSSSPGVNYKVRTHVFGADHTSQYYHLVDLPNGKHIALCSAYITMPYYHAYLSEEELKELKNEAMPAYEADLSEEELKKVKKKVDVLAAALRKKKWENTDFKKMQDEANIMGWYAFRQDHWAFWSSDETPLIIVMPKTPISKRIELFNHSFKKWVIERRELLAQDPSFLGDPFYLKNSIEDIWEDYSFPLHIQTIGELEEYLRKFHRTTLENGNREESFEFLLAKWKGENYISKAFKQRLSRALTTWINERGFVVWDAIMDSVFYDIESTRAQQDKGYQTMIELLSSEGIEVDGGKLLLTREEWEEGFPLNLYYVPNSDPTQKLRGIYIGKKDSFEEEDEYDESED